MLSAGMFSDLAARMAVRRRGLVSGSPPFLAAIWISLIRRVKILPRLASRAPFLCLIVAHFEWPDIAVPYQFRVKSLPSGTRRFYHLAAVSPRSHAIRLVH